MNNSYKWFKLERALQEENRKLGYKWLNGGVQWVNKGGVCGKEDPGRFGWR